MTDLNQATNDEEFELFNEQLKRYLGFDVSALKNIASFVQQQQADYALQPLKQEWGDEFDSRFSAVRQEWEKLPENERAIYDTPEGVRFLYQRIASQAPSETPAEQPVTDSGAIPQLDRKTVPSGVSATPNRYRYTQSQITKMTADEYRQNQGDILQAFADGAVDTQS